MLIRNFMEHILNFESRYKTTIYVRKITTHSDKLFLKDVCYSFRDLTNQQISDILSYEGKLQEINNRHDYLRIFDSQIFIFNRGTSVKSGVLTDSKNHDKHMFIIYAIKPNTYEGYIKACQVVPITPEQTPINILIKDEFDNHKTTGFNPVPNLSSTCMPDLGFA